jgi:hypothetical protein
MTAQATRHKFWEEPVPTLLQIAAICHLRHDVSSAQHIADPPQQGVRQVDLVQWHFIAGEMDDGACQRRQVWHSNIPHVGVKESRTATDM